MSELELLEKLNEVEEKIQIAEIKLEIGAYASKWQEITSEHTALKCEEKEIISKLKTKEDKTESQNAKNALRQQMALYVSHINNAAKGLKLSRSQGMLENYLFTQILNDLDHLVRRKVFGLHVPSHLRYTFNEPNAVEISDLSEFLNQEIQILNNLPAELINYPDLRNHLNNLKDRLIVRFIE